MSMRLEHPARTGLLGLLVALLVGLTGPSRADDMTLPVPSPTVATQVVSILDARDRGLIRVDARGAGQERVTLALANQSDRRLRVILPPGLVAANATAQGFQNMGLGNLGNVEGQFGGRPRVQSQASGFRSVGLSTIDEPTGLDLSVGQAIDLEIPAVCLNYSLTPPRASQSLELVDIAAWTDEYDTIAALRTLGELGTSHGTAQAVMWHLASGLSFDEMLTKTRTVMNPYEVALAAHIVEVIRSHGSATALDESAFARNRLFVRLKGRNIESSTLRRISDDLNGREVLGLPVMVVESVPTEITVPALVLDLSLATNRDGEVIGRTVVRSTTYPGRWTRLGEVGIRTEAEADLLDAKRLAVALDGALAAKFVTVKIKGRRSDATRIAITNGLPMTLDELQLASDRDGRGVTVFGGLGLGPARTRQETLPTSGGSVLQVRLRGL